MTRIRPSTITVGLVAVLFGLLTAYAARHAFRQPSAREQEAARPMASIVVAKANLPQYSRIGDDELSTVEVPLDEVPEGAVRVASQALARLVKTTIMAGRPILDSDLYGVGEVPLLADQLPPGHRAVTLQVDANSALNGMIQPESYVDVAMTVKGDRSEQGGLTTVTLLGGAKVLATSQTRFPNTEDRPSNLRNITLAVTPKEANKLILAQRYGTLSVTLCSNLEAEALAENGFKNEPAGNQTSPSDLIEMVFEPVPERHVKTVQVWRGGQMQQLTFEESGNESYAHYSPAADAGTPTPAVYVGTQPATQPAAGCKECQKNQRDASSPGAPSSIHPGVTAQNVPTLAPPPPSTSLAAGGRYQQGPRGQVIFVPVETDGR